ncbi:MAG TPA: hypothetical protein VEW03_10985 [Longimicrobiaceae bacterium]|nr:hypothetical protein [Longimicrobiaceae bacterium]
MRTGVVRRWLRSLLRLSVGAYAVGGCAVLASCGGGPAALGPGGGKRVLFVGNSLTYTNDLPGMVQAMAAAAGETMQVVSVAVPAYSLEDHWNDGDARTEIRRGGWDVVVLQQGPSSLPESRVLLLEYVRRFGAEIRAGGAEPALYAVWPSLQRAADFDRVSESYALAAQEVDGMLFPAGEAWRAAWRREPALQLYGADDFHPAAAGTYAAALVIFGKLYGRSPVGLPAQLRLRSGAEVRLNADAAEILQRAAEEANAAF